jgi:hypothetical protein
MPAFVADSENASADWPSHTLKRSVTSLESRPTREVQQMMRSSVVLAFTLSLAVAGCGGHSEVSGGDYSIFVHDRALRGGGDDALVSGRLAARNGCVLLEDVGVVDIAYPVIWPSGTSVYSEDPLTLRLDSAALITAGMIVSGGGGYHQASSESVEVAIPAECLPETGEVAVFNPDADLSMEEG